jgi:glycosyltransferase involved in cell wall biosynthesis
MSKTTPITVLISVFNSSKFIRETLESVLNQTFSDYEILIVDDGSTDETEDIIYSYKDKRMKYVKCNHNFIKTWNTGLQLANGKYVAFIDHDDLMMPERLEIQFNYMESNPDVIVCGGYIQCFGLSTNILTRSLCHSEILKDTIIGKTPILNPTGFFRRKVLNINNIHFKNGYSFAADFKFWTDMLKVGRVNNIPLILTKYRTYMTQTSIIHSSNMRNASLKIQFQSLNYILSLVDKKSNYYNILSKKLIPAFNELSLFSQNITRKTFFDLMYEIVCGIDKDEKLLVPF